METEEKKRKYLIAQTMFNQIGGGTLYMLGAKNKAWSEDKKGNVYISFKVRGTAGGKANYIKMTYIISTMK